MRTVGLIGGMSWESTQHYYQLLNQYVRIELEGHNSIEAIIYSVNFERILALIQEDNWESVGKVMIDIAQKLERAGADFLVLTSNAIHKVFPQVEAATGIPILHIVDPTAEAIKKAGVKRVGLLGTKVTMEESFYKDRLTNCHEIEVIIPDSQDRESLHEIIFDELTVGKTLDTSREVLVTMIKKLQNQGVEGIILGCTELTLLIGQKDIVLPLFDTTAIHAKAAVDLACSN